MPQSRHVYIPNMGSHDYSDARRFGSIISLTQGRLNILKAHSIKESIEDALSEATAQDYILVSSHSLICGLAMAIFGARFNRLNLLLFEPRRSCYVPREILLTDGDET